MRRRNIIAGWALIIFTILYGSLTSMLPARTLPNTPDPSFFPWINTAIILSLSLWLLVSSLKLPNTADGEPSANQKKRMAEMLGAFVLYVAAIPGLGFILATVPFFAVMMLLFGERRWAWLGGGAIGGAITLYLIFRHGFGVFLPRGLLAGIMI